MVSLLWSLKQYRDAFSGLYESSEKQIQCAIDHRVDILLEKGNTTREPVTKHLRNGIFELRVKDRRFIFYFGPEKEIIIVHSIIKKKNEVGNDVIKEAEDRRKLISEGKEEISDV
ncbi:MAG: type II toxin-antitoxin system RelE/ParE family toxin [Leptospirillum sp.]